MKLINSLMTTAAMAAVLFMSGNLQAQAPAKAPAKAATKATAAPSAADIAAAKAKGMVWVNTSTKVYHKDGEFYGNTKQGAFMTEADAMKSGARAAKESPIGKKGAKATDAKATTTATDTAAPAAKDSKKKKKAADQ